MTQNPNYDRALKPFDLTAGRLVGVCRVDPNEAPGVSHRPIDFVRVARDPYTVPGQGLLVDFESDSGSPVTRSAVELGLLPDEHGRWHGYVMPTTPS